MEHRIIWSVTRFLVWPHRELSGHSTKNLQSSGGHAAKRIAWGAQALELTLGSESDSCRGLKPWTCYPLLTIIRRQSLHPVARTPWPHPAHTSASPVQDTGISPWHRRIFPRTKPSEGNLRLPTCMKTKIEIWETWIRKVMLPPERTQ